MGFSRGFAYSLKVGDWCWYTRHASPCRVVDRQDVWGETSYRVWLDVLDDAEARVPDLNAMMMLRVGEWKAGDEDHLGAQIA